MCGQPLACKVWRATLLGCVRLRACVRPVVSEGCWPRWPRAGDPNNPSDLKGRCFVRVYLPLRIGTIPSISRVSCQGRRGEPGRRFGPPIRQQAGARPVRRRRVDAAARHQLPGDPRHLVGERHRRELGGLALDERFKPAGRVFRRAPARPPDHRGRPDHEQAAQHRIAGAGDPPRPRLAGRRMVARRQPEPGGEVAPRLEEMRVRRLHHQKRGDQRTNPGIASRRGAVSLALRQPRRRRSSAAIRPHSAVLPP